MIEKGGELLSGDSVVVRRVVHVEDEVNLLIKSSSEGNVSEGIREERSDLVPCTESEPSHELIQINQPVSLDIKLTKQPICSRREGRDGG